MAVLSWWAWGAIAVAIVLVGAGVKWALTDYLLEKLG
jgi:hypothetical protein